MYKNGSWAQWNDFKNLVNSKLKSTTQSFEIDKSVAGKKVKVTTNTLNIRPEPNTNYDPVGTLKLNDIVTLEGQSGKFYKIAQGFISKDYANIIEEEQPKPSEDPNAWKTKELDYLKSEGIDFDYDLWKTKIDDPMPAWAVFILMARIHRNLK